MSKIRKIYFNKLILRSAILIASLILFFVAPSQFDIVNGWNFFEKFSIFHVLWIVWIFDMIKQLVPAKNIALGSQKIFRKNFRPTLHKLLDWEKLKDYIIKTNKAAGKVMILWVSFVLTLGALKLLKILNPRW